jgi:hypothetical protein
VRHAAVVEQRVGQICGAAVAYGYRQAKRGNQPRSGFHGRASKEARLQESLNWLGKH